jgi:hypothetical protein
MTKNVRSSGFKKSSWPAIINFLKLIQRVTYLMKKGLSHEKFGTICEAISNCVLTVSAERKRDIFIGCPSST